MANKPDNQYQWVDRKKSCDGKIKHASLSAAEYYLHNFGSKKEKLEIYKCRFCKKYHLGHEINSKKL